ncbi:MAG: aminomethyl-transferring glycine dehydrogenase, partial [Motiliproteus sp.]|nr:aminomethyl-transferring glycine dehydrogenase [Motiliproteus sp.]
MSSNSSLYQLEKHDEFIDRHIGPDQAQIDEMLQNLDLQSLDQLTQTTLPEAIQLSQELSLGTPVTETEVLQRIGKMAASNKVNKSYIGLGYYNTLTPNVILRNLLENPGWYTAYTPYQPEISQGRLELLLNYQQMVTDLTGMDLANASLLDEATAAAEAMTLCKRSNRKKSNIFFIADDVLPQTLDVVKTRAEYFGFEVVTGNPATDLEQHDCFGVLLQYPGSNGNLHDISSLIESAQSQKAMVCVAADLLSLVQLKSPGEMGADVVLGSAQRFGVPMGFGGPHAAFFATREKYKRSAPGRIIGVSIDSRGNQALRMAMQTREQHIRREKATSNICTAQALLANMAAAYAVYHGPDGLKRIAGRVQRLTAILAEGMKKSGVQLINPHYFDTLTLYVADQQQAIYQRATEQGVNLRLVGDQQLALSLDETTTRDDINTLWTLITGKNDEQLDVQGLDAQLPSHSGIPDSLVRTSEFLTHPVFNRYHSETEMLRYLKRLENKDFSLTHGMIPLGSCTMKLNATAEMIPVTWPEFANIHPFAPRDQVQGYMEMINELEAMLAEVTGYDNVSMQPNSGAQGEYAGLLAIRKYQESIGESHRDICLIPSS